MNNDNNKVVVHLNYDSDESKEENLNLTRIFQRVEILRSFKRVQNDLEPNRQIIQGVNYDNKYFVKLENGKKKYISDLSNIKII